LPALGFAVLIYDRRGSGQSSGSLQGVDYETFKLGAASQIPLRRVGQPQDIANVIAFLCSDESSFVSGQNIYVRGGP